ncbi:MAG: hypothetical protein ACYTBX_11765 [Planctomycetota bacterium]|jgi:hypothetical protein
MKKNADRSYEKQSQNKPNSKPISVKAKMNANAFSQKDYENKTAFRPQNNKPKQTQFQIGRQKRKNGTFYAAHPTYIKEL